MKLQKLTIFAVSILLSVSAYAGTFQQSPVEIKDNGDGSGEARGSQGSARFSENEVEFIGCRLQGRIQTPTASARLQVSCSASDENGTQVSCRSTEPEIIGAMQAISAYSWIFFTFDMAGNCTLLQTSTRSLFIPDSRNLKGKK